MITPQQAVGETAGRVLSWVNIEAISDLILAHKLPVYNHLLGPTGGNVRPAAISSNAFFDNKLVAHGSIADHSAEFPKTLRTGNCLPYLPYKSASSECLRRQSASAKM